MCGIIGINSNKPVSATIINSLKKLEYRGYDSAGMATLYNGLINEVKSEGRVENLEKKTSISRSFFPIVLNEVFPCFHCLSKTSPTHTYNLLQNLFFGGRR